MIKIFQFLIKLFLVSSFPLFWVIAQSENLDERILIEGIAPSLSRINILNNNGFILDEKVTLGYTVNNNWVNISRESYNYDENLNRIQRLYQYWDGSAWHNDDKDLFFYEGNNQIEWIVQNWIYQWFNYHKHSYLYDGNDNLIQELYQDWDGSSWSINVYKFSNLYDANNNKIEKLFQSWMNNNWYNERKYLYTYDLQNNLIEKLEQYWNGNTWVNRTRDNYSFDENNNLTIHLIKYWYYDWFNDEIYFYTYDDDNNKTEELSQNWYDTTWSNYTKYSYAYDTQNNLVDERLQVWVWSDSLWVNHDRWLSAYDQNNNKIEWIWQYWSDFDWRNFMKYSNTFDENGNLVEELRQDWIINQWLNNTTDLYTYIPFTGVEGDTFLNNNYYLENNYPNPFNPVTKINYQIPQEGFVSIKVFDLLGREVATLVSEEKPAGGYEVEFDGSDLSSGIYFYKLQARDYSSVKKMILLK